jgi:beta-fructofuranosidase
MTDRSRPSYHYSSGGWMNDVIPYWDGRALHAFFNHHKEPRWGRMRWGHAVTGDLAGWATAPFAIVPSRGGPDEGGVWTGCVVDAPEGPAALYTGISTFEPFTQVQCLARSGDTVTWEKRPEPVITTPPDGYGDCFRDPYAWWDGDRWRMVLGSALREAKVAAVLAYESPDLVDWAYAGPLHVARTGDLGHEAECPELFGLGGRQVLVASSGSTRAVVGSLTEAGTFVPDGPAVAFDPGTSYAARSVDAGGRRIQLAWLRDARSRVAAEAAGWMGALSLPRELTLGPDQRLAVAPVPELERLQAEQLHDGPVPCAAPGASGLVPGCVGPALELRVDLGPVPSGRASLVVGCDPAGEGGTVIEVDWSAGTVAGHDLGALPRADPLRLHAFLDASVVEVFALGRVLTLRNYDVPADPRVAVRVEAAGHAAPPPARVTAWRLAPPPGSHPVGTPGVVTA